MALPMQKSVLLSKHLWLSGQVPSLTLLSKQHGMKKLRNSRCIFPWKVFTHCLPQLRSFLMLHDASWCSISSFTKSSKRPAANPSASLVGCRPRIVNPKYISKGTYLLKEKSMWRLFTTPLIIPWGFGYRPFYKAVSRMEISWPQTTGPGQGARPVPDTPDFTFWSKYIQIMYPKESAPGPCPAGPMDAKVVM